MLKSEEQRDSIYKCVCVWSMCATVFSIWERIHCHRSCYPVYRNYENIKSKKKKNTGGENRRKYQRTHTHTQCIKPRTVNVHSKFVNFFVVACCCCIVSCSLLKSLLFLSCRHCYAIRSFCQRQQQKRRWIKQRIFRKKKIAPIPKLLLTI